MDYLQIFVHLTNGEIVKSHPLELGKLDPVENREPSSADIESWFNEMVKALENLDDLTYITLLFEGSRVFFNPANVTHVELVTTKPESTKESYELSTS